MPPLAYNTLQDVVHWQILEGKTGAAKRGFFPALSSRLTFPLVARMPWRGLQCVHLCRAAAGMAAGMRTPATHQSGLGVGDGGPPADTGRGGTKSDVSLRQLTHPHDGR